MSMTELPDWVWDLIDSLERYEDEHPMLYRLGDNETGELVYLRTECWGNMGLSIIPREVRDTAAVLRARAIRPI